MNLYSSGYKVSYKAASDQYNYKTLKAARQTSVTNIPVISSGDYAYSNK